MGAQAVELLAELIARPSVNPRLASAGSAAGEGSVTAWLAEFAQLQGWRWATQAVHPQRDNFIALIHGESGECVLWEAHQDTVGVEGMTIAPFAATERDGLIYGRGACDVKGGLAAMLTALATVSPAASGRPTILLAATVNEECGFTGARALAEVWHDDAARATRFPLDEAGGLSWRDLRALRPTSAIVAEPTELSVVVAHRGVARWQITCQGRAAHSSRPHLGANAVSAMASVVTVIDRFQREVLACRPADPLCGPSTVAATTFHGGTGPNTIPDRAVIDVDRRLMPEEAPEAGFRELVDYVAAHADLGDCRLEHAAPWMQSRGLPAGTNDAWSQRIQRLVRGTGRECRVGGVPYGTNAASLAAAGIPTIVFGPGSIDQAHTVDEWIAVEQLDAAVEIFTRIAQGADG